jgi:hypothetical protein
MLVAEQEQEDWRQTATILLRGGATQVAQAAMVDLAVQRAMAVVQGTAAAMAKVERRHLLAFPLDATDAECTAAEAIAAAAAARRRSLGLPLTATDAECEAAEEAARLRAEAEAARLAGEEAGRLVAELEAAAGFDPAERAATRRAAAAARVAALREAAEREMLSSVVEQALASADDDNDAAEAESTARWANSILAADPDIRPATSSVPDYMRWLDMHEAVTDVLHLVEAGADRQALAEAEAEVYRPGWPGPGWMDTLDNKGGFRELDHFPGVRLAVPPPARRPGRAGPRRAGRALLLLCCAVCLCVLRVLCLSLSSCSVVLCVVVGGVCALYVCALLVFLQVSKTGRLAAKQPCPPPPGWRRGSSQARSHCRFVPPLHTISNKIFGTSKPEPTMRPNPRSSAELRALFTGSRATLEQPAVAYYFGRCAERRGGSWPHPR